MKSLEDYSYERLFLIFKVRSAFQILEKHAGELDRLVSRHRGTFEELSEKSLTRFITIFGCLSECLRECVAQESITPQMMLNLMQAELSRQAKEHQTQSSTRKKGLHH